MEVEVFGIKGEMPEEDFLRLATLHDSGKCKGFELFQLAYIMGMQEGKILQAARSLELINGVTNGR